MNKRSVIIVGAGVGGSTAAFFMAKAGLDVLLLEKDQFPRDKPCGDGLPANLTDLWKEMGVLEEVYKYGNRTTGITWMYDGSDARYSASKPISEDNPPMYACPRYIYDNIINQAALKAGVDYMDNFDVVDLIMERGKVIGIQGIHNGKPVDLYADLIVLAAGSHFLPSRKVGFYEENPDYVFYGMRGYFENIGGMQDIEFWYPDHFAPGGYMWIFPEDVETKRGNVGIFLTETALKKTGKTMEELYWDWAENTKYGKERLGNARLIGELKGWRLPTGMHRPVHTAGCIAVGDTGNMIEPFGGGGIPQAQYAGKIAAEWAAKAVAAHDFSAEFLQGYADALKASPRHGGTYQGMEAMRMFCYCTGERTREFTAYMADPANKLDIAGFIASKAGIKLDDSKIHINSHS